MIFCILLELATFEYFLVDFQECAQSLGVGELYGLFACMVTNRSWDAIGQGIDRTATTADEVAFFCSDSKVLSL